MPLTPLHYPVGYALSKLDKKKRLPFPGLIMGSFIPDIEVLPLFFFFKDYVPDHFFLHSLIGSLTLGTVLAVLMVRYLYPPIISTLFKVDRTKLDEACRITPQLALACMVGAFFHVFVDVWHHWYNPVFWPFVDPFAVVGPFVLLFTPWSDTLLGAYFIANGIAHVVFAIITLGIMYSLRGNLWERFWLGDEPVDMDETEPNTDTSSGTDGPSQLTGQE